MYQYPYGNAQQLNLDWLMEQWQEVKQSIDGSLQGEIDRVEAAITDLLAARDAAVAAAGAANTSAGAAAASAQAAAADAATATAQAAAATQERVNAAQAANNAQSYAGTAQTQAAAAQNAAGQAAASASQAAADASDAHDDAVAASGSAVNAAASAAGALQNFQLSDAARQAAQAAEQDAEAAATLLQPPATSADIGKALIVKTVGGGTVTEYELGESGGGGGGTPAIVQTIEDVPIASFEDGTVNPVQQLIVDIEPVQAGSGDPAPDNVRPITGWTGANVYVANKNLCDPNMVEMGNSTASNIRPRITFNKPGKYTIRANNSYGTSVYVSVRKRLADGSYDTAQTIISNATLFSRTITVLPNETLILFAVSADATVDQFKSQIINWEIQCELSETATSYEPYSGSTYPITFPTEAGTVYGGTLTKLDTDEWKLTIENGKYSFNGTENIVLTSGGNMAFGSTNNPIMLSFIVTSPTTPIVSHYKGVRYMTTLSNLCAEVYNGATGATFTIRDENFTTVEDYKTYLAAQYANGTPVSFVLPLNRPVEYTLTTSEVIMLLAGYNNVWADTGNINLLQYYADSKKYIDEQDTLVKALIAPVLDGMVADTALTANDFRIVDNTLYRITAPVAAGAALTPNTNCTATTIGAILKTLLS